MQKVMQNNCAVYRTGESLAGRRQADPRRVEGRDDLKVTDRSLMWNSDLVETLEFDNLIVQAVVTMVGAENRKEAAARTPARISRA